MRGGENEPSEHHKFTGSRKFASLASSDVQTFFHARIKQIEEWRHRNLLSVSFHRNEKNCPFKGHLHF